jgi:hypothetical protein
MYLLTEEARLVCTHETGIVHLRVSQNLVRIEKRWVLIRDDPEHRTITMCPNVGAAIQPCTRTQEVREGYSHFVTIVGQPVCLDTVSGLTNGTPQGAVRYEVRRSGQDFVSEAP